MPECTIVTTKEYSTLCIFYSSYIKRERTKYLENGEVFYWQHGGWSGIAYTNTNKMHSSPQQPSSKSLKFLSTQGHEVVQNFDPTAPKLSGAGCVCLCFCSSPASRSSVVSTRPQSSHQTQGTQPCCHSAQRTGTPATEVPSWTEWSVCCFPRCWNSTPACLPVPMRLRSLSPSFLFLFYLSLFFPFPQHTYFARHSY